MRDASFDAPSDVAAAIWDELQSRVVLPGPAARQLIRRNAGLTQTTVAEIVGVDRSQIVRWEQGETDPRGDNRRRYAEALRAMEGAKT